ncbi:MAG: DUF1178 family protein [Roseitalea porphyridii]|uniref:DUF1178 family protein n=1 Tax=Roseitalea porphyridii TaxID=1852022 RepID=UPI0032ECB7E9
MIVYDLKCRKDHVFEAWFADSASFAEQAETGKVICPVCGSTKVSKALMAPAVLKGSRGTDEAVAAGTVAPAAPENAAASLADTKKAGELRRMLRELRQHVEDNCDYVGKAFAEEARKIHYGESDPRGIYGETSDDDARELEDEGIEVSRVPWLPRENS